MRSNALRVGFNDTTASIIGFGTGLTIPLAAPKLATKLVPIWDASKSLGRTIGQYHVDPYAFGSGIPRIVKKSVTAEAEVALAAASVSETPIEFSVKRANTNPYVFDSELYLRRKEYSFVVSKETIQTNKVWQRDGIINPKFIDTRTGLTNLQLMQRGRAPIGADGCPIELHHTLQTTDCPLAEIMSSEHKKFYKQIHINRTTGAASAINRAYHISFREQYWIE